MVKAGVQKMLRQQRGRRMANVDMNGMGGTCIVTIWRRRDALPTERRTGANWRQRHQYHRASSWRRRCASVRTGDNRRRRMLLAAHHVCALFFLSHTLRIFPGASALGVLARGGKKQQQRRMAIIIMAWSRGRGRFWLPWQIRSGRRMEGRADGQSSSAHVQCRAK